MKSLARPRKIFLRYLLSYLAMFAIPILIMILLIYSHFIRLQRENVESAMRSELSQIAMVMDERLSAMVESTAFISKDSLLTPYRLRSGVTNSRSGIERIGVYLGAIGFADELFLITKGDGRAYTASGVTTVDTLIASGWHTLWSDIEGITVYPRVRTDVQYAGHSEPQIIFCYPLPLLSSGSFGAVVYGINRSLLAESLDTVQKDCDTFMIDPNGTVIIANGPGYIDYNAVESLLSDVGASGIFERKIDGENYSLIVGESTKNGWRYASLMPTNVFLSDVLRTQVILVLVFALLAMLGLSLAFFLSFSYYRPIETLYRLVLNVGEPKEMNKINFSNLVANVVERDHRLTEKVDQSVEVLRDNFFQVLIRNHRVEKETLKRLMQLADIRLSDEGYTIFAIRISMQGGGQDMADGVLTLLKKLYESCHFGYIMETRADGANRRMIALLCNLRQGVEAIDQLKSAAEQLCEIFLSELGIEPIVGIGSIADTVEQIGTSYTEALIACDQCPPYERISAFCDIELSDGDSPSDSLETLRLMQYLKQGNFDVALASYNQIGQVMHRLTDARRFRMARLTLAGKMAALLGDIDKERYYVVLDILVHELGNPAFDEAVVELIREICSYTAQAKMNNRIVLAHELISYIHTHSANPEMSLTFLSEAFTLSASTVNRMIKDASGQTFNELLSETRMEHARELLKQTEKRIYDIVEEIGYQDIHSFIRKFKRMYGKTPGQYRKEIGEGEN